MDKKPENILNKHITTLFRTALAEHYGVKPHQIVGMQSRYVRASRNIREYAEGNEPKALLFKGSPYVIVYTDDVVVVTGDSRMPLSSDVLRKTWADVAEKNFPKGVVTTSVGEQLVLDPFMDSDGRVLYGFAAQSYAKEAPTAKPVFPARPAPLSA